MIRKGDVQWWVSEAKNHPEAAPEIVEKLAQRLIELDAENEHLREKILHLERAPRQATETAEVDTLRDRIATLQALVGGEASDKPALVFLSQTFQATRLLLSQVHSRARQSQPALNSRALVRLQALLPVRPYEDLLCLTTQGRGLRIALADIPPLLEGDAWPTDRTPKPEPTPAPDERLATAVAVAQAPRFWTIVTRRGIVHQVHRIDFDRRVEKGTPVVESPVTRDTAVALVDGDEGDLLVLTRWGRAVRFPQRAIPAEGAIALGVEPDDEVVGALSITTDGEILLTTGSGYCMRRATAAIPARKEPGGEGKPLIQAFDVLGAWPYDPQARLLYLTYSGQMILAPVDQVLFHPRAGKGNQVCQLDRDPAVAATLLPHSP